jgi:hypothetical protein
MTWNFKVKRSPMVSYWLHMRKPNLFMNRYLLNTFGRQDQALRISAFHDGYHKLQMRRHTHADLDCGTGVRTSARRQGDALYLAPAERIQIW